MQNAKEHADRDREALSKKPKPERSPYVRPENEDDDGYDPFSDRPPTVDPLFEKDPWD